MVSKSLEYNSSNKFYVMDTCPSKIIANLISSWRFFLSCVILMRRLTKVPRDRNVTSTKPIGPSLQVFDYRIMPKRNKGGFPGGAVVKNPPANAEDTGSSPGLGRSHMPQSNKACAPQLLSLCSRAREPQPLKPVRLEPALFNEKPPQ